MVLMDRWVGEVVIVEMEERSFVIDRVGVGACSGVFEPSG